MKKEELTIKSEILKKYFSDKKNLETVLKSLGRLQAILYECEDDDFVTFCILNQLFNDLELEFISDDDFESIHITRLEGSKITEEEIKSRFNEYIENRPLIIIDLIEKTKKLLDELEEDYVLSDEEIKSYNMLREITNQLSTSN